MGHFSPTDRQARLLLAAAGLLEVAWAVGMKYTDGFSGPLPSLLVLIVAGATGLKLVDG